MFTWLIALNAFLMFLKLVTHPFFVDSHGRPVLRVIGQLHPVQSDDADGGAGPALLVSGEAAVHRRLEMKDAIYRVCGKVTLVRKMLITNPNLVVNHSEPEIQI